MNLAYFNTTTRSEHYVIHDYMIKLIAENKGLSIVPSFSLNFSALNFAKF